ncbi:MAG: HAD-IIIC family phosphatase [Dehalococcoidia bacterium]|jgi:FkbH-like protein|nr:HAD-IIIC family phosphatase [Dehalococcoidia bacterium]|tara:strand:+ start:552 stop:2183 length:1632 start_codon:yes stop_codon:yes gene_type:complete
MEMLVYSSSFLPNVSSSWKHTEEVAEGLVFSEFGNIVELFEGIKTFDKVLCVIFQQDLTGKAENLKARYSHILKGLEKSLPKTKGQVFLAFSDYIHLNVTKTVKKKHREHDLINEFKNSIYKLVEQYPSFHFIDLDAVFAEIGYLKAYDSRNWYFAHMRLSQKGFLLLDETVAKIIYSVNNSPKKILVLDCDNTLWKGVIGEDGIDGIQLGTDGIGKAFQDFQREVREVSNTGTLLAVSSKNELNDVMEVFQEHSGMILKPENIVSFRVNWSEKHKNIKEISEELNIGLNSFVFWDDNPLEREKIKKFLPEVEVVEVPNEVNNWPKLIAQLASLSKITTTEDDVNKLNQYKQRSSFIESKKEAKDDGNFLKDIKLEPELFNVVKENIPRSSQLAMKTNQFNFRTQRYAEDEISKLTKNSGYTCKLCKAKDIFGDHGDIGLVILEQIDSTAYFLDTFLLSCRILGRNLELWIMQKILNDLNDSNVKYLYIEFIPTERNKPAKEFLDMFQKFRSDFDFGEKKGSSEQYVVPTNTTFVDIKELYKR